MKTFLEEVVDEVIAFGTPMQEVCIVLPAKRTITFIQEYFRQRLGPNSWLPNLITWSELTNQISSLQRGDKIEMLLELYRACIESMETKPSFVSFLKWAPALLNDFNEIDQNEINPKTVFVNLRDIKDIEEWSLNQEELTDSQKAYIKYWESLGSVYETFNKNLANKGVGYSGKIYQTILDEAEVQLPVAWNNIHFVGLNALSRAELKIISRILNQYQGQCFWDGDKSYVDSSINEAGIFIREAKAIIDIPELPSNLLFSPKKVHFIETPNPVAQAKMLPALLKKHSTKSFNDTVVVLPDESILPAVLTSLPEEVDKVNITMGSKEEVKTIKQFFEIIFRGNSVKKSGIHYKTFFELMDISFVKKTVENDGVSTADLIDEVKRKRLISVPWSFFNDHSSQALSTLAKAILSIINNTVDGALVSIREYFEFLWKRELEDNDREVIYRTHQIVNKLRRLNSDLPVCKDVNEIKPIFISLIKTIEMNYIGEPLQGLQIMGLLETRSLDFKNVILLSCNETNLPKSDMLETLIPGDLRAYFGLPDKRHKEAIFAYYFFRLIQRVENVYLVHNTLLGGGKPSTKSRYLEQFKYMAEIEPDHKIEFEKHDFVFKIGSVEDVPLVLNKSKKYEERIAKLIERGISATSLNTWLGCPVDFYFRYVLKYGEIEDDLERMQRSTFGTIIHNLFDRSLKDQIGKSVDQATIKAIRSNIDEELEKLIEEFYFKRLVKDGENLLQVHVMKKYVNQMLDWMLRDLDANEADPFMLHALEGDYDAHVVDLNENEATMPFNIKGQIDRIDENSTSYRVIDYKTGKVEGSDLSISKLDESLMTGKKPKVIQLLMYSLMVNRQKNDEKFLSPGIVSSRNISLGFQPLKIARKQGVSAEQLDAFEALLIDWVHQVFDNESQLMHKHDAKYCEYCSELEKSDFTYST